MKTNGKNRSLLLSATAILVSIALLTGATLAWFTDTETNYGNSIKAGTLDIDVVWYELDDNGTKGSYTIDGLVDYNGDLALEEADTEGSKTLTFSDVAHDFENDKGEALISEPLWEPGLTSAKLLEVTYTGTLDAVLYLNAIVEADAELEDALWFDFIQVDPDDNSEIGYFSAKPMYELATEMEKGAFDLDAITTENIETVVQFIVVYGMNKSAGNTYQDTSYSADIVITATQANADAVGDDTTFVHAYDATAFADANLIDNSTIILMNDITAGVLNLGTLVNIDLNGYTLTCDSFAMDDATSFETVDIENGKISATSTATGAISVQVPKGSVTLVDVTLEGDDIILDASDNTLILTGTTSFKDGDGADNTAIVMANTRVVVETTEKATLEVAEDASNVSIEVASGAQVSVDVPASASNVEIVLPEGSSYADMSAVEVTGEGAENANVTSAPSTSSTVQNLGTSWISLTDAFGAARIKNFDADGSSKANALVVSANSSNLSSTLTSLMAKGYINSYNYGADVVNIFSLSYNSGTGMFTTTFNGVSASMEATSTVESIDTALIFLKANANGTGAIVVQNIYVNGELVGAGVLSEIAATTAAVSEYLTVPMSLDATGSYEISFEIVLPDDASDYQSNENNKVEIRVGTAA